LRLNPAQKRLLKIIIGVVVGIVVINTVLASFLLSNRTQPEKQPVEKYWFVLHRKSNKEELLLGVPGEKSKSKLIKTFQVRVGIPNERPTPLPQLLGREYWVMTAKEEQKDNPETAPYFLTLNVPAPDEPPYGPVPYKECNGVQCDWVRAGPFGLHGVNGDPSRLTSDDPGSSGCIRHTDEDITYLYNLLDPHESEIRYYIEDN
jgi:hypothetical protein